MSNALIDLDAGQSVSPSPSPREENQPVDTDTDTGLVQMANKGAAIDLTQLFLRLELKLVTSLKELITDALSSLILQVEAEIWSLRESFDNLNSRVTKLESIFERSPQPPQSKENLKEGPEEMVSPQIPTNKIESQVAQLFQTIGKQQKSTEKAEREMVENVFIYRPEWKWDAGRIDCRNFSEREVKCHASSSGPLQKTGDTRP